MADNEESPLTRTEISTAVGGLGWRYLMGALGTAVTTGSLARSVELVERAVAACGPDADGHLWADVRADRAVLTLHTRSAASVTPLDLRLAGRISAAITAAGGRTDPCLSDPATVGPASGEVPGHAVQIVEIGIDALSIPAIRPFWRAILAYTDESGTSGPTDPLVDPARQSPTIWFQQMDQPRPQRNRIHFDIAVPHDEALRRIEAALDAGGVLVSDHRAPAFWVLADIEGNEACITTWQGRD